MGGFELCEFVWLVLGGDLVGFVVVVVQVEYCLMMVGVCKFELVDVCDCYVDQVEVFVVVVGWCGIVGMCGFW